MKKRFLGLMTLVMLPLMLNSCQDVSSSLPSSAPSDVKVSSSSTGEHISSSSSSSTPIEVIEPEVVIDIQGETDIEVGDMINLYVFVANAEDDTYLLTIKDDSTGAGILDGDKFTATKAGTVTIVATSNEDATKTAELVITITEVGFTEEEKALLFAWELDEETDTMIMTEFLGEGYEELVLPTTFNGKKITTIGSRCFDSIAGLKRVVIPEGYTTLETYAFRNCADLEDIVLPTNSLTTISSNSFYQLKSLYELYLPGSVVTVPKNAVGYCTNLVTLKFGYGITSLEGNLFTSSSEIIALKNLVLPNSLMTIGDSTFTNCTALNEDNIQVIDSEGTLTKSMYPSSLTAIGKSAFNNTGLERITLPTNISLGESVFSGCVKLTSVTVTNGITELPNKIFQKCISLTTITLPASLTSIGDYAFNGCISLETVNFPEGHVEIGANAFNTTAVGEKASNLTWLEDYTTIPNYVLGNARVCGQLKVNSQLEVIGQHSLRDNPAFTGFTWEGKDEESEVSLPETVTTINTYSLANTGIEELIIPKSITTLGDSAFRDNLNLKKFGYEEGLTTLPKYAYSYVSLPSQDSYVIPSTATEFLDYSFANITSGLETLDMSQFTEMTSIPNYSFRNNTAIKNLTGTENITEIGSNAFNGAKSLTVTKDTFKNVTEFGASSLINSGLTSFYVPAGVTTVGNNVLKGAPIASFYIPTGVDAAAVVKLISPILTATTKTLTDIYFEGDEEAFSALGIDLTANTEVNIHYNSEF